MSGAPAAHLHQLQEDLQRRLLGSDSPIAAAIVDAPPMAVAERLDIYRNAYRTRLIEALDDTYPVLLQLLGDEMFAALGQEFIARHPSVHRSLRWYGAELARYLAENDPYREQPVLSEVALLEWTLAEVFDAEDCGVIERSSLTSIAPQAWGELQFEFHPSLRRLELLWNAAPVWQAMNRGATPPQPECGAAAVTWLLWRKDFKNYFRSLDNAEAAALDAAIAGCSFAEVCDSLREWLSDNEIPPAAANYLGAWADSGIIAAFG